MFVAVQLLPMRVCVQQSLLKPVTTAHAHRLLLRRPFRLRQLRWIPTKSSYWRPFHRIVVLLILEAGLDFLLRLRLHLRDVALVALPVGRLKSLKVQLEDAFKIK